MNAKQNTEYTNKNTIYWSTFFGVVKNRFSKITNMRYAEQFSEHPKVTQAGSDFIWVQSVTFGKDFGISETSVCTLDIPYNFYFHMIVFLNDCYCYCCYYSPFALMAGCPTKGQLSFRAK